MEAAGPAVAAGAAAVDDDVAKAVPTMLKLTPMEGRVREVAFVKVLEAGVMLLTRGCEIHF